MICVACLLIINVVYLLTNFVNLTQFYGNVCCLGLEACTVNVVIRICIFHPIIPAAGGAICETGVGAAEGFLY